MFSLIISFCAGLLVSAIISFGYFSIQQSKLKEDLIKQKAINDSRGTLEDVIKRDFVKLANETIKNEQEDLRKQNRESLEEKINPLTKELAEFKEKIEKFNISGVENTVKIIEQIGNLEKNNKTIELEAKNLVNALTKNQNVKGAYGENLLDVVLESCGMKEGVHYSKQVNTSAISLKDDEIHKIRPDVVINLPNNKHLVIDSKVTLTSYLKYIEDNSRLDEFKDEVKKRISDLAKKNYQNASGLEQADFVLMYMPIEASVSLLYEDYELISQAYKSNIIIVGTSSLIATIRLVNQLLAQQKQAESVQQIVNAGTNLYETFVQFCEDLIELQTKMNDVSSKFTTVINRFKRGNKNKPSLFSQVNALKDYGINSTKNIPDNLIEEVIDEEDESENVVAEGVL